MTNKRHSSSSPGPNLRRSSRLAQNDRKAKQASKNTVNAAKKPTTKKAKQELAKKNTDTKKPSKALAKKQKKGDTSDEETSQKHLTDSQIRQLAKQVKFAKIDADFAIEFANTISSMIKENEEGEE